MSIFRMKSYMAFNGKYLIANLISNQIFAVVEELIEIADVLGITFEQRFVFEDGKYM